MDRVGLNGFSIEEINNKKPDDSRLTAIENNGFRIKYNGDKQRMILCQCICGKKHSALVYDITTGHVKSCGCLAKEGNNKKFSPHIKKLHNIYLQMISRCYNHLNKGYSIYGGRGVTVCEEWKNDYQEFLNWSLLNGYKEGLQIDKEIKGNGLLYSPQTCIWATIKQQANNKRTSVKHLYNGSFLTIYEISEVENIKVDKIAYYVYRRKTDINQAVKKAKENTIKNKTKIA